MFHQPVWWPIGIFINQQQTCVFRSKFLPGTSRYTLTPLPGLNETTRSHGPSLQLGANIKGIHLVGVSKMCCRLRSFLLIFAHVKV